MIERMQIAHEEQIAKRDKEKAILKQRAEEADLNLVRSQKEAESLRQQLAKRQAEFDSELQRLTLELEQREASADQTF